MNRKPLRCCFGLYKWVVIYKIEPKINFLNSSYYPLTLKYKICKYCGKVEKPWIYGFDEASAIETEIIRDKLSPHDGLIKYEKPFGVIIDNNIIYVAEFPGFIVGNYNDYTLYVKNRSQLLRYFMEDLRKRVAGMLGV